MRRMRRFVAFYRDWRRYGSSRKIAAQMAWLCSRLMAVLLAIMAIVAIEARAAEWALEDMNRAIEQTNFAVNQGCSGTLISKEERLILTNFHCIDDKIEIVEREEQSADGFLRKVRLNRYRDVPVEQNKYVDYARVQSMSYVGEIKAADKKRDLAVVQLKGEIPHTYAAPLRSDERRIIRGERVYAVGNPAGNYATVVEGIVSSVNRTFEFSWTGGEKLPMIQFSGGIWGGNSGGALYDSHGELIGVPAAGHASASFIGLAIPVSVVKAFLKDNCLFEAFDKAFKDAECREKKAAKKTARAPPD